MLYKFSNGYAEIIQSCLENVDSFFRVLKIFAQRQFLLFIIDPRYEGRYSRVNVRFSDSARLSEGNDTDLYSISDEWTARVTLKFKREEQL